MRYVFDVVCPNPRCAGSGTDLTHENGSHGCRLSRAVVYCSSCERRYLLVLELTVIDPVGRKPGDLYMSRRLEAVAS